MPSDSASSLRPAMMGPKIHLPPPYSLIHSAERDVLAKAAGLAPDHGAGTLVLHQSPGLLAFAVVLEPEQPLAEARQAFVLGMAALADALAAHCPPERPVSLQWPDQVIYDAARLGGGRMAATPGCAEDEVPDWLVFAAELIADRDHVEETGRFPDSTSLKEESFDSATDIVASFASYMMLYFDRWAYSGFSSVTEAYLKRVQPSLERRIEGDRMVEIAPSGATKNYPTLRDALTRQEWRDKTGPRL